MTTTHGRRRRIDGPEKDQQEAIHPVDRHVGVTIRALRNKFSISQTALAAAIGVTFQQVQKYESGANRVSASMLYDIARFLRVPVPIFFEGLPPTTEESSSSIAAEPLALTQLFFEGRDGGKLVELIARLSPTAQRALTTLIDQLQTGDNS